ncbi:3-demethylubiquinone-9 3-methyltransferase [Bosea sp. AAP35]|uniref:DUF4149 domain-containing protein n=1 Tax=Bosea sp. AAP35 TaxID=1523417 RepID=UPI0006B8AE13|nr:DUF4149 domain-containing protein [Bosea sp. AAP35]KPF69703.1 3-demethylubiquinone-9 3-methyltransferase [Bosea sp. AAP35]
MMQTAALLTVALLFGGMVLFSFGFAAILFATLSADEAGRVLRRAFPHFYLFVIATSALAAALVWTSDGASAAWLAAIAVSTIPTRQLLMPAINAATDAGDKSRFKILHGASVAITLAHIALTGFVLSRFV